MRFDIRKSWSGLCVKLKGSPGRIRRNSHGKQYLLLGPKAKTPPKKHRSWRQMRFGITKRIFCRKLLKCHAQFRDKFPKWKNTRQNLYENEKTKKKTWRFIEVIKNVNDRFGTVSSVPDSFTWLVYSSICVLVNWLCLWLVARCIFHVNCQKLRTFSIKNTIFRFEESNLFAKQSTCIYWIFNDLMTVELTIELFNYRILIQFCSLFLTWWRAVQEFREKRERTTNDILTDFQENSGQYKESSLKNEDT